MTIIELKKMLDKYDPDAELGIEAGANCSVVGEYQIEEIGEHLESGQITLYLI